MTPDHLIAAAWALLFCGFILAFSVTPRTPEQSARYERMKASNLIDAHVILTRLTGACLVLSLICLVSGLLTIEAPEAW